ncbi:hypothetical protein [Haloplasma contractile]|uniref:hypothetical protein n=1 Tax=Haloplasma contractile TaxID=471825 RepID=UPI001377691A|nr:hypothetical protein [Haloplasma contractile]
MKYGGRTSRESETDKKLQKLKIIHRSRSYGHNPIDHRGKYEQINVKKINIVANEV